MSNWLFAPKEVQAVLGSVDVHLQVKRSKDVRLYDKYHPSAFGQCLRKMQYYRYAQKGDIPMPVEKAESKMIRIWENGHYAQSRWEKYFQAMGILRGLWRCDSYHCRYYDDDGKYIGENHDNKKSRIYGTNDKLGVFQPEKCCCGCKQFSYEEILVEDKELNISGHVDMVLDFSRLDSESCTFDGLTFNKDDLPEEPFVVDMKTCNKYAWDNKVMRSGPSFAYQIQITIYSNMLGCDYGMIIYENKNDQTSKAFKVLNKTDTWYKEIKRQIKLMDGMIPLKKLPPPRPVSKSDYECKNCPFSSMCHKSKTWSDEKNLRKKRHSFYGELLSTE